MSFQVDTAMVQAYKSNIEIQFQQKGSRLRDKCLVEPQSAEFEFYDRIGPTEAVEVLSRHGDTPLISTPHDRRRLAMRDFDWADMIDKKDKIRMLADPTSSYTVNSVYAFGRKLDDVIITALEGSAWTGKTGSTEVVFKTATQDVAVNYVETGGATNSNLTIGKLRRMRYVFDSQDTIEKGTPICLAITASQVLSLLKTTEVTNADYNTVKALVQGEINTFMGFDFVRIERLRKVSNTRYCLAWPKNAIQVGMGQDVTVDVGPRRDKRNSIQVYVNTSFGASRMWEEMVVRVACDESV